MKFLTLIFIFSATFAFADPRQTQLYTAVGIVDEANRTLNGWQYCENTSSIAPAYCKDLYGYVCSQQKKRNLVSVLKSEIGNIKDFEQRIRTSESRVSTATNISRDEVRLILEDAKSELMNFATSTPLIDPAVGRGMSARVKNVSLKFGHEYVDAAFAYYQQHEPNAGAVANRTRAQEAYTSSCGKEGLHPNAFYTEFSMGGKNESFIVICPGLLISMSEYGGTKEDMKTALTFTFGHELGHSIDAYAYPSAYDKMKSCYEKVTKNPNIWIDPAINDVSDSACEMSADYWGAIAITSKLKTKTPQDAARVLSYATDGFCLSKPTENDPHPPGSFRVNQSIGKHQLVAETLQCQPPTEKEPFCSLRGIYPGSKN